VGLRRRNRDWTPPQRVVGPTLAQWLASRRESPQPIRQPGEPVCPYCGTPDKLVFMYVPVPGVRVQTLTATCDVHGLVDPAVPEAPSIPGWDS
jgi:hypothetical protein